MSGKGLDDFMGRQPMTGGTKAKAAEDRAAVEKARKEARDGELGRAIRRMG